MIDLEKNGIESSAIQSEIEEVHLPPVTLSFMEAFVKRVHFCGRLLLAGRRRSARRSGAFGRSSGSGIVLPVCNLVFNAVLETASMFDTSEALSVGGDCTSRRTRSVPEALRSRISGLVDKFSNALSNACVVSDSSCETSGNEDIFGLSNGTHGTVSRVETTGEYCISL